MAASFSKNFRNVFFYFKHIFLGLAFGWFLGHLVLAVPLGRYIGDKGVPYALICMAFGALIGAWVAHLIWRKAKWRKENPVLHAREEAEQRERQKHLQEAAAARELNPIWIGLGKLIAGLGNLIKGVARLVICIIALAVIAVVIYVAYGIISGLSVTWAIILGACIIALAIVAVGSV